MIYDCRTRDAARALQRALQRERPKTRHYIREIRSCCS